MTCPLLTENEIIKRLGVSADTLTDGDPVERKRKLCFRLMQQLQQENKDEKASDKTVNSKNLMSYKNKEEVLKCINEVIKTAGGDILKDHATNLMDCINRYNATTSMERVVDCICNELKRLPYRSLMMYLKFLNSSVKTYNKKSVIPCKPNTVFIIMGGDTDETYENVYNVAFVFFNPIRTRIASQREVDHLAQAQRTRIRVHDDSYGSRFNDDDILNPDRLDYYSPYFESSWKRQIENTENSFKYNNLRIFGFTYDRNRSIVTKVTDMVHFMKNFGQVEEFHEAEFNTAFRASKDNKQNTRAKEAFGPNEYAQIEKKLLFFNVGQKSGIGNVEWLKNLFKQSNVDGYNWYYKNAEMKVYGPYTTEQMRKLKTKKTIKGNTLVGVTNVQIDKKNSELIFGDNGKKLESNGLSKPIQFFEYYNYPELSVYSEIKETDTVQGVKRWMHLQNTLEIENLSVFYNDVALWCAYWLENEKENSSSLDLDLRYGLVLKEKSQIDHYEKVSITKTKQFKEYIYWKNEKGEIEINTYDFVMFRGENIKKSQTRNSSNSSISYLLNDAISIADFLMDLELFLRTVVMRFVLTEVLNDHRDQSTYTVDVHGGEVSDGVMTMMKTGGGIFTSVGAFILTIFMFFVRCSWTENRERQSLQSLRRRNVEEFQDAIEFVIYTGSKSEIFQTNKYWSRPVTVALSDGAKLLSNAKKYMQSYTSTTEKAEYYYYDIDDKKDQGPYTVTEMFNMYKTQRLDNMTLVLKCMEICPFIPTDSQFPYDFPNEVELDRTSFRHLKEYDEITGYNEWFYFSVGRSILKLRTGSKWHGPYTTEYMKHLLRGETIDNSTMIKKQYYTIATDHIGTKQEIVLAAANHPELLDTDSNSSHKPKFCVYGSQIDDIRAAIVPHMLTTFARGFVNMKSLKSEFSEQMEMFDALTPPNPIKSVILNDNHLKVSDLKKKKIYQTYKNLSWIPHCIEYGGSFCPTTIFADHSSLRVRVNSNEYFNIPTGDWLLDTILKFKTGDTRIKKQNVLQVVSSILDTTQIITNHINDLETQLPEYMKIMYRVVVEKLSNVEHTLQQLVAKISNMISRFILELTGGNIDNKLIQESRKFLKKVLQDRLSAMKLITTNVAEMTTQKFKMIIQTSIEKLIIHFPVFQDKIKNIASVVQDISATGVNSVWYGQFTLWSSKNNFTSIDYSQNLLNDLIKQGDSLFVNIYQDNWRKKILSSKSKRWEIMRLNFMTFYNKQNANTQSTMKTMMYVFLPEAPEKLGSRYDLTSLGLVYQESVLKHFPIIGNYIHNYIKHMYKIYKMLLVKMITQKVALYSTFLTSLPLIGKYMPDACSTNKVENILSDTISNIPAFIPGLARYLLWDNIDQTWQWSDVKGPLVLGNQMYSDTLNDSFDPDNIRQIAPFPVANSEFKDVIDFYVHRQPKNGQVFEYVLKEKLFAEIFQTSVFSMKYDDILRGYHKILHMSIVETSDEQTNIKYISDIETPFVPTLKSIRNGVPLSSINVLLMLPRLLGYLQFIHDNATSLFLCLYIATMTSDDNTTLKASNKETFLSIKEKASSQSQVEIESLVRNITHTIRKYMNPEGLLFILRYITLCTNHMFVNMMFEFFVTGNALNAIRPSEGPFLELKYYSLTDSLTYTPTPYHKQKNGMQLIKHCIEKVNFRYSRSGPTLGFTQKDVGKRIEVDYKNKTVTLLDPEERRVFDRTYYSVHFIQKRTSKEDSRIEKVKESFNGLVQLKDGTMFHNPKCILDYNKLIRESTVHEVTSPSSIKPTPQKHNVPIVDPGELSILSKQIDYAMYAELEVSNIPLCSTPFPLSLMQLIENDVSFDPTIYASHFVECITVEYLYSNNKTLQYMLRSHVSSELIIGTDKALQMGSNEAFVENEMYEWWVNFGKLFVKHLKSGALYVCKQTESIKKELKQLEEKIVRLRKQVQNVDDENEKNSRKWVEIVAPKKGARILQNDDFIQMYQPAAESKDQHSTIMLLNKPYDGNVYGNTVIECDGRFFKKMQFKTISVKEIESEIESLDKLLAKSTLFWAEKLVDESTSFQIQPGNNIVQMEITPKAILVENTLYTNFVDLNEQLFSANEFMTKLNANYLLDKVVVFEQNGQHIPTTPDVIYTLNEEYFQDDTELVLLIRFIKHQEFRLQMLGYYNGIVKKINKIKAIAGWIQTGLYYFKYFHIIPWTSTVAWTADLALQQVKDSLGSEKFIFTSPNGELISSDDAHREGNFIKLSLMPVDSVTHQPDVVVPNLFHKFDPPNFSDKIKSEMTEGLSQIFTIMSGMGQQLMNKTQHMKLHAKNMFKDNLAHLEKLSLSLIEKN